MEKQNNKNPKELYIYRIKSIAPDERFFEVPDAKGYAMSSYGRLYKNVKDDSWHKVKLVYDTKLHGDAYQIKYDYDSKAKNVLLTSLLKEVFFQDEDFFTLYNPDFNPVDTRRWNIDKLIPMSKTTYIQTLLSKMCGVALDIKTDGYFKYKGITRARLNSEYQNMRTRATNKKFKEIHKEYWNTIMCYEWLTNPVEAKQYMLDRWYYYPGEMCMDKDIMTFGLGDMYAPEFAVPLPVRYNNMFCRGSSKLGYCIKEEQRDNKLVYIVPATMSKSKNDIICTTYLEALKIGRIKKEEYIRRIVLEERKAGFIPEYILNQMDRWADKCECGELIVWEPSPKELKKRT